MRTGRGGFTLVELLVTVAIVGILAATAIPFYAQYRQRAFNARAVTDCWDAINAEEAYYATHYTYIALGPLGPTNTAVHIDTPGFTLSPTVRLEVTIGYQTFTVSAESSKGSLAYSYNNVDGRIEELPL